MQLNAHSGVFLSPVMVDRSSHHELSVPDVSGSFSIMCMGNKLESVGLQITNCLSQM
jgi:hypothetical protein